MTELKPCPFCGGEAEAITGDTWMQVGCPKCNITTATISSLDNPDAIIEAWNTRYEPTCAWKAVCDERWWETECGMTYECYDAAEPPNYCPNCGAKVVGE